MVNGISHGVANPLKKPGTETYPVTATYDIGCRRQALVASEECVTTAESVREWAPAEPQISVFRPISAR